MTEAEAIISSYDACRAAGRGCVLATVVHVEGSSYRRAGARMLVDEEGRMTGAISGGCLEGDALRKALHALHQQQNKLVTYDTTDEDDAVIGAQLGCNGIIRVLFEPVEAHHSDNVVTRLRRGIASGEPFACATLFRLNSREEQPGTVLLHMGEGYHWATALPPAQQQAVEAECRKALQEKQHQFAELKENGDTLDVFVQYVQPPVHLVIVGAGNDALVLAEMAQAVGWNVTVTDGRPTHANHQRFGSACTVIVAKPEDTLKDIRTNTRTAFVLMSHNYQYDVGVLQHLLTYNDLPYIGILGPQKKYRRMLDDLAAAGIHLTDEQSARLYAPVGLRLGAETPAEIALSVTSEIQAVMTGSQPGHLRHHEGPIHDKAGSAFKVVEL